MKFLRDAANNPAHIRPGLVLLDLNLLRDDHEVLRNIKDDPDLRTTPVVAMTSFKDEEDIWKVYDA